MIMSDKTNGLDVMLYEMQAEFNNALKIKDYRAMSEIITEAHRIKSDNVGGFLSEMSNRFYFTELSQGNEISIPPEVIKPLEITPDTELLVYMDTTHKHITIDPDNCITLEQAKCISSHIKLANRSKISKNGELLIHDAMIKSLGVKTGDIIIITADEDSFEIRKYSDDFSWKIGRV